MIAQLAHHFDREFTLLFGIDARHREGSGFGVQIIKPPMVSAVAAHRFFFQTDWRLFSIAWFTVLIVQIRATSSHAKEYSPPVRRKCNVNSIGGSRRIFSTASA